MGEVPLQMALDNIEFGTLVVDADGIVTFYSRSYDRGPAASPTSGPGAWSDAPLSRKAQGQRLNVQSNRPFGL